MTIAIGSGACRAVAKKRVVIEEQRKESIWTKYKGKSLVMKENAEWIIRKKKEKEGKRSNKVLLMVRLER